MKVEQLGADKTTRLPKEVKEKPCSIDCLAAIVCLASPHL